MAHDFLGNELSIGDDVVFLNYNVTSASLERGKITRVSEHTAEISGIRRAEYKIIKVNPVKPTMDNTWIPCSERMPDENNRWVLCLCVSGAMEVLKFDYTMWNWDAQYPGRCYMENYVTHWMPLPEPPKEKPKDEKN